MLLRLDKFLADMGIGTRSQVKAYIRKGRISVNDKIVKKPETKIDLNNDIVFWDETKIEYKQFEYYMLNKPQGIVSATQDNHYKTVLDAIHSKKRKDLFPVGRLDIDTEGLLLITNDGELCHQLLSPKKHVDKCYFAKINGYITKEDIKLFEKGINLGDFITKPAKLEILKNDKISEIQITIQEGKYHQVKRMFEAIGKPVLYLKRLTMGSLILDEKLKPGEYRSLTEKEIKQLRTETGG